MKVALTMISAAMLALAVAAPASAADYDDRGLWAVWDRAERNGG